MTLKYDDASYNYLYQDHMTEGASNYAWVRKSVHLVCFPKRRIAL